MTSSASATWYRSRTLQWCLILYLAALGVRAVFYVQVRDNPLYLWPTLDENTNHHAALAVLEGTMPSKAYLKAPVYLYTLVGVYSLFGPEPDAARLIQVFIAALWAPLTFLIAEALFGRTTGILAGLLGAVFWTFVFFSTELLDVALGGTLYLLTACLIVRLPETFRWTWLLCGLALGLSAITRPNILACAPLLAIAVAVVAWRSAEALGRSRLGLAAARVGWLTLGCCLAVLPVTMRNRVVGGEWVLIGAYGGVNFYLANNPEADAKNVELLGLPDYEPSGVFDANDPYNHTCFTYRKGCDYTSQQLGRPCTRGEMNRAMFALGGEYIQEHPAKFASDVGKRLCWFFNAYEYGDNKDLYQFREFSSLLAGLSYLHFGIVCPLIVVGLVAWALQGPRTPAMAYYGALLVGLIVPGTFFLVNARFRVTIVCLLAPLAAYGLVTTLAWCRPVVHRRRLFLAALVGAGVALFSNANVFGYRPPCHPYLLFIYAAACGATGHDEEMARTIEKIERADAMNIESGGHGRAMYCLFEYYDSKGQTDKALHYARRMLDKGQLDARASAKVFKACMRAGDQDLARDLLEAIWDGRAGAAPRDLAEAMLAYGKRYHDAIWCRRAEDAFRQLASRYPTELMYHRKAGEAEEAASQAVPSSSRKVDRLDTQGAQD